VTSVVTIETIEPKAKLKASQNIIVVHGEIVQGVSKRDVCDPE